MPVSPPPLQPYQNTAEFADDLERVLREDYGIELSPENLQIGARNVKALLHQLLC